MKSNSANAVVDSHPHALVLRTAQKVRIGSFDKVVHNVHQYFIFNLPSALSWCRMTGKAWLCRLLDANGFQLKCGAISIRGCPLGG